ncbi:MAG: copper(I)-binding protein [Glaciecola sp.]
MLKGIKTIITNASLLFLIVTVATSANVNADVHAQAQKTQVQIATSVSINDTWVRATFALAKTGAAYFSVTNNDSETIVLTSVVVDESIAMMAQLHHTVMEDDMMRMQELEDGIEIKAGATVELSPGGMHVMIMGLQKPFNKGESIEIELHFKDGSQLTQIFPILEKRN